VVITGLTRNQFASNRTRVRIPPPPPSKQFNTRVGCFFNVCVLLVPPSKNRKRYPKHLLPKLIPTSAGRLKGQTIRHMNEPLISGILCGTYTGVQTSPILPFIQNRLLLPSKAFVRLCLKRGYRCVPDIDQ
jgi:hypothetical protein